MIVGVALTLFSLFLHFQNFQHAGALWRDEVNTVELASEPSLTSIYSNLHFDSFPMLWVVLLRSFMRLAGSSDAALRGLGLVVGALSIATVWINARLFPHRIPAISLLLIGVNGALIRYGDSLRGYGIGVLTGLLMFGALWNLTRRSDRWTILFATVSSLLAVHSLFYNAVVLFAACMGGIAVMLRRRDRRGIVAFLSIGAISALSLALYLPMIQGNRAWSDLVRYNLGPSWFWNRWGNALAMNGESMRFLWTLIFVLGCSLGIATLRKSDAGNEKKEVALFCLTTLLVGTIGYFIFLSSLNYLTEPWYYLTLMALIASCLDSLFGLLDRRNQRLAISVIMAVLATLAIEPVLVALQSPQTNIDLIAGKISNEASADDLVFVFPWQVGISFQRYYRGVAEWQTLPPVAFHRWHRYDLYKQAMSDPVALERFLADVEVRLAEGGRVWIVAPPADTQAALSSQPRPRLVADDQIWRTRLDTLLENRRPHEQVFRLGTVRGDFENLLLELSMEDRPSPSEGETRPPRSTL